MFRDLGGGRVLGAECRDVLVVCCSCYFGKVCPGAFLPFLQSCPPDISAELWIVHLSPAVEQPAAAVVAGFVNYWIAALSPHHLTDWPH